MIDSADDLITDATQILDRGIALAFQAGAVVMNLFLLEHVYGLDGDARVLLLRERLAEAVKDADVDLRAHQVQYAMRLAEAPGTLSYEEMHKLFSLLDEIHALGELGDATTPVERDDLERAVRARFTMQKREARMAAEDRREEWNRNLWWYADVE